MTVNQDVRLTFRFLSGFVCSESQFPFEQELTDEIFLRKQIGTFNHLEPD